MPWFYHQFCRICEILVRSLQNNLFDCSFWTFFKINFYFPSIQNFSFVHWTIKNFFFPDCNFYYFWLNCFLAPLKIWTRKNGVSWKNIFTFFLLAQRKILNVQFEDGLCNSEIWGHIPNKYGNNLCLIEQMSFKSNITSQKTKTWVRYIDDMKNFSRPKNTNYEK